MSINQYIQTNWELFTQISKKVLQSRWREGISEYYIHLIDKNKIPTNPPVHCYYFMQNINKPNGPLNYKPVTLKTSINDIEVADHFNEDELDINIDFVDEELKDFLLHNTNSEKWIKIFKVVHRREVDLDLFETILFEYIFLNGYSAKHISEITGNSISWVFGKRKKLINKIKEKIC
jgi:hypothetical protein